jgi:hypothetical protein
VKELLALLLVAISSYRAVKLRYRMWTRPFPWFKDPWFYGRLDKVQKVYITVYYDEETYYTYYAFRFPILKGNCQLSQYQMYTICHFMNMRVVSRRLHGGVVGLKVNVPDCVVRQDNGMNVIMDEYTLDTFCKRSGTPKWILSQVLNDCRDFFYKTVVMDGHIPVDSLDIK